MRRLLPCLVVLFIAATAATGVRASTDCERWFAEYKNALAHTKPAKQLRAANHRVRRYVHSKLAAFHKPKPARIPKVLHARVRRPKMTREEMMRHFNLACGDLPEDSPSTQMLQSELLPPEFFSARPLGGDIALDDGAGQRGLIASNVPPSYTPGENSPGNTPSYGFTPGYGGGFGGGALSPRQPTPGATLPDQPGSPVAEQPVVTHVPEPSSVLFVLTGLGGAAGMVRRRLQANGAR